MSGAETEHRKSKRTTRRTKQTKSSITKRNRRVKEYMPAYHDINKYIEAIQEANERSGKMGADSSERGNIGTISIIF